MRDQMRRQESAEQQQHGCSAEVVDPLSNAEPKDGNAGQRRYQNGCCTDDDGFAFGDPGGGGSEGVGEIGDGGESDFRHQDHGVDPEVPGHEESGEVAERGAGPLIKTALECAPAVEVNDDHRMRNVKENDAGEPEDYVGWAELGGITEIGESHDEQDLGEDEVAQAEFAFEPSVGARRHRQL